MSSEDFAAFRRAVLDDRELQQALLDTSDRAEFDAVVVDRARALGLDVGPLDLVEEVRASRIAWQQRWI